MADAKKLLGGLGKVGKRLMANPDDARLAELMAHSGDNVLPLVLPRARMTPEFIDQQADRVARQMLGEHVTSGKPKDTTNLAGRSMKESQRLKGLNYKLNPTGNVAQETTYVPRKGDVKVAFPGDQTVADKVLESVEGFPIDSVQEGGAYYGLGQKHLKDPEFWKSNKDPAKMVQGKVDRVAELFEPERVIGSHLAMGPTSNNFAMHFADANLRAIDWSKVKPKDINVFDNIVASGYKDPKTGERVTFPNWPGMADRDAALAAMKEDSNLRKWFNNRMKTPSLTQPLNLPNGLDIQYAITEPRIRDMEINMTGLMTGELKPGALVEAAGNPHNTYSHRILGEAQGPQEVLTPFVIGFPDAAQHIATTKRPSDFTGTIQKVFPHQVVDDQYLDEYNRYRERIKKLTGQKKGGAIDISEADKRLAKAIENRMAKGGAVDLEAADARLQAAIDARISGGEAHMADGGKLVKGATKVFKKLFDDAPTESQAAKQARLNMMPTARIGLEAPGILIPSKMNNVREAVRNMKGNYGARRVERAADEIPSLERMYQEDALKEAFTGDNASAMTTMRPSDFEKYAIPLDKRVSIGPKMAELAKQGDIDKYTVPTDEYIQHLLRLEQGFSDVPYLNLTKDEAGLPTIPKIIGHEGRHRNRALAERGEPSGLVQINPRGDLREGLPRRTQEEFIEALKQELEMSNRLVLPEVDGSFRRPTVDFPDIYADGGDVHMADGGKLIKGLGKIGKRLMANPEDTVMSARRGERMADEAGGLNIVKETGGNWLGGETEKQLKKLQMGDTMPADYYTDRAKYLAEAKGKKDTRAINAINADVDTAKRNDAMNKWMESNLNNYVKKQMGTADDPVRKLAEQDILHMKPYGTREAGSLVMRKRAGLGYPAQGLGQSDTAKFWERLSDQAIDSYPAGSYKHGALDESILENNPWLKNVPDETMIHSGKGLTRELGFDHIIDVLREDLRAGRIRPEQLNKVSMEQAVRRTHEYDQEMARRMAETQAKITEGMPVHKDYADKGYKWIELAKPKLPDVLPEGWSTPVAKGNTLQTKSPDGNIVLGNDLPELVKNIYRRHPETPGNPDTALEKALKYEGDTMGHCVGSYCDEVAGGKSRIYSLRDAKGEPHVTIETRPQKRNDPSKSLRNDSDVPRELIDNYQKAFNESGKHSMHFSSDFWPWLQQTNPEEYAKLTADLPPKIVQIKGKQNAAPKEDYLPFVQDFVKSGEWSEVGDLKNTGLIRRDNKYLTPDEDADWLLKELGLKPDDGMAEGGAAFKKIQFMGGGGITTSGGTFSPEELGVEASDLGISDKRMNQIKRNAADLWDAGKGQLEQEYKQLGRKGGKRDFAVRVGSQLLGGFPDLVNLGLEGVDLVQSAIPALSRPESVLDTAGTGDRVPKFRLASDEPWLGSQQFIRKFKEAQLLGDNEFPITELAAGFVAPAAAVGALKKGKQAYKGAKALVDTPKKRRGGLTAMAR